MDRVPFYGMIVGCNDDAILRRLFPKIRRRMVTYGTRKGSDFLIRSCSPGRARPGAGQVFAGRAQSTGRANEGVRPDENRFSVRFRGQELGEFRLHVPGLHNILNATAAIAVGVGLDIPVDRIREALENFRGVDRRFQVCGEAGGVTVIDDYGHHPTEIRATLAAARQCGYRKIHVIFQPHRYTRTRDLIEEFATAFGDADSLQVLDIYPASELPIEGITGETVARTISEKMGAPSVPDFGKGGDFVRYAGSFEDAATAATTNAHEGDMILTLGAGSVSQLAPMLLEKLQTVSSPVQM